MLRLVNFVLVGAVIVSAFWLYGREHAARLDERRMAALSKEIGDIREDIRLLDVEWSYLSRPARIKALAIKHLGMKPVQADQFVTLDELATRLKPRQVRDSDGIGDMLRAMP